MSVSQLSSHIRPLSLEELQALIRKEKELDSLAVLTEKLKSAKKSTLE